MGWLNVPIDKLHSERFGLVQEFVRCELIADIEDKWRRVEDIQQFLVLPGRNCDKSAGAK